ncbi:NHL repeat-containing protein, partial [bacterium]|nr:NHL repeat-containing protein [bacterium]
MRFFAIALGLALLAAPPSVRAGTARLAVRHEITLPAPPKGPPFRAPRAVTVDPFGNLFLADTGNHRVLRYDPKGRFVFEYGGFGWRDGELSRPSDVCANDGFRLFVADEGNERIQEFDILDENAVGRVFPFVEGNGLEDEALVRPSRIQLDREGRIYVSDPLCHCVWIFAPTGELVNRLGSLGEASSRFRDPDGVAVGPKGRVYVADTGNRRIQVFDAIGNW